MILSKSFYDKDGNLIEEKKCLRCLNIKKLKEFTKSGSGKYGVHNYCRECLSKYNKNHYSDNKYIKKKKAEMRKAEYGDKTKEHNQEWYFNKISEPIPENKQPKNPLDDLPPIDPALNF